MTTMTRITDMRGNFKGHCAHIIEHEDCIINTHNDLQAESSGWLFKSPLAGAGVILWWPHHRPL